VATLDPCCIQACPKALTEGRAGLEGFGDAMKKLTRPNMRVLWIAAQVDTKFTQNPASRISARDAPKTGNTCI